jgi:chromosome segregation ATPase
MQIIDLESRLDKLIAENRALQDAKLRAEQAMQGVSLDRETHASTVRQATDALASRDVLVREKEETIAHMRSSLDSLQQEVARLTEENAHLHGQPQSLNEGVDDRYATLEREHQDTHGKWQESLLALATLRQQHETMSSGMEDIVRDEISKSTASQTAEIQRLQQELATANQEIHRLEQQLLVSKQSDDFLVIRDEDYFEGACQQLCQHVQQWVLRFSKFSDSRACRLSSEVKDDKIEARLDDAILDGSDVDMLLADRVKRRDVFMSVVMSMIWDYIFTRYLFGMDKEQRQKLKGLEKILIEVGKC